MRILRHLLFNRFQGLPFSSTCGIEVFAFCRPSRLQLWVGFVIALSPLGSSDSSVPRRFPLPAIFSLRMQAALPQETIIAYHCLTLFETT